MRTVIIGTGCISWSATVHGRLGRLLCIAAVVVLNLLLCELFVCLVEVVQNPEVDFLHNLWINVLLTPECNSSCSKFVASLFARLLELNQFKQSTIS